MLKQKQQARNLSFAWAAVVGLLSVIAQVVTFYVRFGFFNTQASFANYAAFFLAGTLGGCILIYFLNRQTSSRARRVVLIAFLLASPLALIMMLAGGLVGVIGVLIAPQVPWALITWLGSLVGKRVSQGSAVEA
jgi:hypothetical protein